MEAGEVEGGGAGEVECHGERDGVGGGDGGGGGGVGGRLEDAQASEREGEDSGRVGGARCLEVLAELEAGEGEALVVGGHGGLEAGEGSEHVVRGPRRLERLLSGLRDGGGGRGGGDGRRRSRREVAAGRRRERVLGFARGGRDWASQAGPEEERGGSPQRHGDRAVADGGGGRR